MLKNLSIFDLMYKKILSIKCFGGDPYNRPYFFEQLVK